MRKAVQRLVEGVWLALGMVLGLVLLRALTPMRAQTPGAFEAAGQEGGDAVTALVQDGVTRTRHTAITRAVAAAEPAVVGINVVQVERYIERSPFSRDPFWGQFFPDRVIEHPVQNLGSGFIISADGLCVTNEHVVHRASKIVVTLPDGREVNARLVGADYNSDIALLDLDGEGYPVLALGDSDEVLIGEWAIAVGNPYGLFSSASPSVTVGVVSATDRDFGAQNDERVYIGMLQTDAAINPGNSGGPLVNALGQAIGMNTMIYSRSGGSVGLGFAIPVNRVKAIIGDLQDHGFVDRNIWTGIWIRDLNRKMAQALGYRGQGGVLVVELADSSPASQAGVQVHDILIKLNGRLVKTTASIKEIIADTDVKVGDRVLLEVFREGKVLTIAMRAGQAPQTGKAPPTGNAPGARQGR
ncbi:MAG: trypsin-like peptidase domain-containing protein [bacterium]|jgi:serine protease Do|nr:trypsin-like peptidase domain-containing protein [bacterium]